MTFEEARSSSILDLAAGERAYLYASARNAMRRGLDFYEWLDSVDLSRTARRGVTAREVNAIVAYVWGLP